MADIVLDRSAPPRLRRLRLSTMAAIAGTTFSAEVLDRTAGSDLRLTSNPGNRYELSGTTLTGKGLTRGTDTPAITEYSGSSGALGGPRESEFAIQVAHDPAAIAFTRPWATPTGPILALSGSLTSATVGTSPTFLPIISGGTAPYTMIVVAGALPAGRSISGTSVIGTYTTAGSYSYTLRVTDAAGATATLAIGPVVVIGASLPATVNYIAEGDSITAGYGVSDNAGSYAALGTAEAIQGPPTFSPLGTGGSWWTHTTGNSLPGIVATSGITVNASNGINGGFASRGVYANYDAAKALNVASMMGGSNDGPSGNDISVYRGIRQWVVQTRRRGYDRVIGGTLISRGDQADAIGGTTFDASTLLLNGYIRDNWNGDLDMDALMDFGAIPAFATRSAALSAGVLPDKTHPNAPGYQLMKPLHTTALNAVVAKAGTRVAAPSTWSPFDLSGYLGLTNGRRTVSWPANGFNDSTVRAFCGVSKGKAYWELVLDNAQYVGVGLVNFDYSYFNQGNRTLCNSTRAVGAGYGGGDGNLYAATTTDGTAAVLTSGQPALATGDVLQFALDADAKLFWYRKAGQPWNGSATADPATGVGGVSVALLGVGPYYPAAYIRATNGVVTSRFAASEQTGTRPVGFASLGA